jgi:hypothetical protein
VCDEEGDQTPSLLAVQIGDTLLVEEFEGGDEQLLIREGRTYQSSQKKVKEEEPVVVAKKRKRGLPESSDLESTLVSFGSIPSSNFPSGSPARMFGKPFKLVYLGSSETIITNHTKRRELQFVEKKEHPVDSRNDTIPGVTFDLSVTEGLIRGCEYIFENVYLTTFKGGKQMKISAKTNITAMEPSEPVDLSSLFLSGGIDNFLYTQPIFSRVNLSGVLVGHKSLPSGRQLFTLGDRNGHCVDVQVELPKEVNFSLCFLFSSLYLSLIFSG